MTLLKMIFFFLMSPPIFSPVMEKRETLVKIHQEHPIMDQLDFHRQRFKRAACKNNPTFIDIHLNRTISRNIGGLISPGDTLLHSFSSIHLLSTRSPSPLYRPTAPRGGGLGTSMVTAGKTLDSDDSGGVCLRTTRSGDDGPRGRQIWHW